MSSEKHHESTRVAEIIKQNLLLLHNEIAIYTGLFQDEDAVKLMNESARMFFAYLQHVWAEHTFVALARLVEGARPARQQNATFQQLANILEREGRADVAAEIRAGLREIRPEIDAVLAHRHKRIAHLDIQHLTPDQSVPLPPITVAQYKHAVARVTSLFDRYRQAVQASQMAFELVEPYGNVHSLLSVLRKGMMMRQLEHEARRALTAGQGILVRVQVNIQTGEVEWRREQE